MTRGQHAPRDAPGVGVLVPTYGRHGALAVTLTSLLGQALRDFRIVGRAVIGLSFAGDERPRQEAIEFIDGPVTPEAVRPGAPQWKRHELRSAANLHHLARRLGLSRERERVYRVAWVGGGRALRHREAAGERRLRFLAGASAGTLRRGRARAAARDGTLRRLRPHSLGRLPPGAADDAAVPQRRSERALAPARGGRARRRAGSTDPRRRSPVERFAALADALVDCGAVVAINGSEAEADLVRAVLQTMRREALDLAGKLSLCGLAGLVSRAALVVSNDTGPLFLAEAVDTATVGIYWLLNLAQDGPLFRTRHRYALSTRVACPTCGRPQIDARCAHDPSFVADVALDQVLGPAHELLGEVCA
jgi:hypothetical protein